MKPAETEDIASRLDLHLLKLFSREQHPVQLRQQLMNTTAEIAVSPFSLANQGFLDPSCREEDERAIVNLIDYTFERFFLPSMPPSQVYRYVCDAEKTLHYQSSDVEQNKPLLLESVHHHMVFSYLALTVPMLAKNGVTVSKVILLHLQPDLDPRLQQISRSFAYTSEVEFVGVPFNRHWIRSLKSEVTAQSLIIYMGDMPASLFNTEPTQTLQLTREAPHPPFTIRTVTIASQLAKHLGAAHHFLDYSRDGKATFRPADAHLKCPLTDWIFWPAINAMYL